MAADRSIVMRLRAEVADFNRQMDSAKKSTEGVGKAAADSTTQANTAMGRLVQSATQNRDAWQTAGTSLTIFGAATVGALGLAVNAAMNWESAWAGVRKTVDGSDAELATIEEGLRNLARTLPATHQEIAAVAEAAGQLGVSTGSIVDFTRVMIDLGETTNLTADEAATSIAQLMNIMQTAPDDVDNLGSALVELGNNGASTERDIIQMAQRIAASGAIIGLTEAEVLGFANALASVGIEVEAGGTSISRVMQDIAKAVSAGGDDLESFAEVAGVSGADFAKSFREDPADAITTFIEGLGGIQAAGGDVFAVLDDLGLADVRVSQALLSMANSGDLLRESLELGNQAWSDNSALVEEAAKRYETTEAKLQIARNGINDAAISIGESLLPVLAEGAEGVANFAASIGDLPDPILNASAAIAGIVGASALAAGGFLTLFPRIIETRNAFKTLTDNGSRVPRVLGNIGKVAGVAAGLAAVAVALNEIHFASKDAIPSVDQVTASLLAANGIGGVRDTFSGISDSFDNMRGAADRLLDGGINTWADNNIGSFLGMTTATSKAADAFEVLGQSLAVIYDSNPDEAERRFAAAMRETGRTREELLGLMPAYADALAATDAEQILASGSAEELAAGMEGVAPSAEAAAAAMEEWTTAVSTAGATFGGIVSAYQSVIDKNTELAQSTADASSSSEDSWEDFYDGATVSMEDWIVSMQEQAAAVTAWKENYQTALAQIADEVPAAAQEAHAGFVEEMLLAGEEGAAALQAFVDGTPEQRAALVAAWEDAGYQIGDAIAAGLPTPEDPLEVPVDIDPANAISNYYALTGDWETDPIYIPTDADTDPGTETVMAFREVEEGIFAWVPVDAFTDPATGEMVQWRRNNDNTWSLVPVDADTSDASAATAAFRTATNSIGAKVPVGANDNPARGSVGALVNWISNQVATITVTTVGKSLAGGIPKGNADGGPIPGSPSSVDNVLWPLATGEHIISAREVAGAGGHSAIAAMRAQWRNGRHAPAISAQGFANGGTPAGMFNPTINVSAPASAGVGGVTIAGNVITADPDEFMRTAQRYQRRAMATYAPMMGGLS